MRWRVTVEADGVEAERIEASHRELERFEGAAKVSGDRLVVDFELEAPSVKRAARAAFVIFGRIAGRNEPRRFELQRLD